MKYPVTGAVLAGGSSSRMGYNKALARLLDGADSPTLLDRSVALLEKVCGRAVVIGQEAPGYSWFPDSIPGKGPMGGIATALEVTQSACLVMSCDLPFMEEDILEDLVVAHKNRPSGTLCTSYRHRETGRIEALVAVYEPASLPLYLASLAADLLKIRLTVPMEQQHFLLYSGEKAFFFYNINTPGDLEDARAQASGAKTRHAHKN